MSLPDPEWTMRYVTRTGIPFNRKVVTAMAEKTGDDFNTALVGYLEACSDKWAALRNAWRQYQHRQRISAKLAQADQAGAAAEEDVPALRNTAEQADYPDYRRMGYEAGQATADHVRALLYGVSEGLCSWPENVPDGLDALRLLRNTLTEIIGDVHAYAEELEQSEPLRNAAAIVDQFADGARWYGVDVIAERLSAEVDVIARTLEAARRTDAEGCRWERRKRQGQLQWRITKQQGYAVNLEALMPVIGPLLAELDAEGRKNLATACPQRVAQVAQMLRQAIQQAARREGNT